VIHSDAGNGTVWILSDGKSGHLAMTRGVAAAMGLHTRMIDIAPPRLWGLLAPHGPAPPDLHAVLPGNAQAWPDFVFAAGRLTVPYLRAMRRVAGGRSLTVAFMDPRVRDAADLIWVPAHDGRRGKNVITTTTSPHGFSPERLSALRKDMPAAITALPAPRVAVLLGGPGAGFTYSPTATVRLASGLSQMARHGVSFLITPSRRTPPSLLDAVRAATAQAPRVIWDGSGDNPYPYFLACADRFVVTADSVNMTGEACATGLPIHVFMPGGGRPKFHSFHAALRGYGATRPLPEQINKLDCWRYTPIDSAATIAAEIVHRAGARPMSGVDTSAREPQTGDAH